MRPKPSTHKSPSEKIVKDIRRATRKHYSAEDKIRIVLCPSSEFLRQVRP
jgi:transposase